MNNLARNVVRNEARKIRGGNNLLKSVNNYLKLSSENLKLRATNLLHSNLYIKDKTILPEIVVTPKETWVRKDSKGRPAVSSQVLADLNVPIYEPNTKILKNNLIQRGLTNQAANERADKHVRLTIGSGEIFTPWGFTGALLNKGMEVANEADNYAAEKLKNVFPQYYLVNQTKQAVLPYGRYISPSYWVDRASGKTDEQLLNGEGNLFGTGTGTVFDIMTMPGVGKGAKSTARGIKNYGIKVGEKALENYFPTVEDFSFKLPIGALKLLYPLRQHINYKHMYPKQNKSYSEALKLMKDDPALQGKPGWRVDLSYLGGDNARIGIGGVQRLGGLRSNRAVINPGTISRTSSSISAPAIKAAIKKGLYIAWERNKKLGDILTGDATYLQDPINTISDLNLDPNLRPVHPYGLSSDSYGLIHSLNKRNTGAIVYGKSPMGLFNPLAEDGVVYNLLNEYLGRIISPVEYALRVENYFRNKGIKIRLPYIDIHRRHVLFPHPSYVEGLNQYIKK